MKEPRTVDETQPLSPENCPNHPPASMLITVWCEKCGADKGPSDPNGLIDALRARESAEKRKRS
jgi:hypothetical protein